MTLGSLFTLLGFLTGGLVLFLEARRRKVATEGMGYIVLAGLVGGVIGAKLTLWAIFHWNTFVAQPWIILDPRTGGRALIGGIAGGWLAVEIAKWRLGIKRSTGNLFALALPAGEAVGRIGCFLNGCCHGAVTDFPLAVWQHDALRHPAQIYSALAAVAILSILYALRDRLWREGDLFRLYLVLYGVARFGIEFLRERNGMIGPLSLVQWICLEIVLLFGVLLILSARRARISTREVGR